MLLSERDLDPEGLKVRLNELGDEGWEFVAVVGYKQLDSIVLKRSLDGDPPDSGYADLVD